MLEHHSGVSPSNQILCARKQWAPPALIALLLMLVACMPSAPELRGRAIDEVPASVPNTTATAASIGPDDPQEWPMPPNHRPLAAVIEEGAATWQVRSCRACHGSLAEGAAGPPLRGTFLSQADFQDRTRRGGAGMRGFDDQELPDAAIRAIHAWLQALPSAIPAPIPNAFGLQVPPNIQVSRFAQDLSYPTSLAIGPDQALYVATLGRTLDAPPGSQGEVWRLADEDGDGQAEDRALVLRDLQQPMDLLWLSPVDQPASLLIAERGAVLAWSAGSAAQVYLSIALPGGQTQQAYSLALGPDQMLYVGQGPTPDQQQGASPQPGAVWRIPALAVQGDSEVELELFASGFRDVSGLAFSPSGAIYATDTGLGWPSDLDVPDELNLLLGGGHYGWPQQWGMPSEGNGTLGPVALFAPGLGPGKLLYLDHQLFPEYANDLLVAASRLSGAGLSPRAEVLRVQLVSDVTGYHSYVQPFISGMPAPMGLAQGPDGTLYVSDYARGEIYRLWR